MPDIQASDSAAVNTLLETTFGVTDGAMRTKFTNIALFMADTTRFDKEFRKVSELLRQKYNAIAARDTQSNVLTRAISEIAQQDYGFAAQDNVVFAGFISPTDITKDYISQGVLWKDGVGSQHGEYSHSLQWLTIGMSGIVGATVADVYKQTVAWRSSVDFNRPNGKIKPYVWDFLVDCFSHGPDPDFRKNIVSQTCRSPSAFTHRMFAQTRTLWISSLIRDRYRRKGIQEPTLSAPGADQDLKGMTVDKHEGVKGYTGKKSGTGMIYSRAITASSQRTRAARGLEQHKGYVFKQVRHTDGNRYPEIITDETRQKKYRVLDVEDKLYAFPATNDTGAGKTDVAGKKVLFEVWGDRAGGIVYKDWT